MPLTVREIESPDPVTSVAATDAAVRRESDDIGEKMVLNMGPSLARSPRVRSHKV